MKKPRTPTPKNDPATYATLSVGSVAAFLVLELHNRLGIDISLAEASGIVLVAAAIFHYAQGKVKL